MKFSELQRLQRMEGITVLSADERIEQLEARLRTITKERDALRVKIETAENDAAHQKALADSALRVVEGWERKCGELRAALRHEADCVGAAKAEIEALRSKIEATEKQEPFDADSDVFRGAFEAALKAGNWPAIRQGDGYRSPSTQIAWRIAFSTVNRLKLYLAPGAQAHPAPSVPDADELAHAETSRAP
jgi:hypothetical protein